MSSTSSSYLDYIGTQVVIYLGLPVLIGGTIGGILNIIVFLSLRTFRQNSCAFYLMIMSVVNVGQLITGALARILASGFAIDWTQTSVVFCKFRVFVFQVTSLMSFTCICLATIDQYMATCSNLYWQQRCNIKLAHRLIIFFLILWCLHGIPDVFLFEHLNVAGRTACASANPIFLQYRSYFVSLILTGFLPVTVTIIFGILAYNNVRTMSYRTVPIVRRELDKQLTTMVLAHDVINFFTVIPYSIMVILSLNTSLMSDPVQAARIRLATIVTLMLYYFYFASSFFIYICSSERFRRQLIYVLFKVYFKRYRRPVLNTNQIAPQIPQNSDE